MTNMFCQFEIDVQFQHLSALTHYLGSIRHRNDFSTRKHSASSINTHFHPNPVPIHKAFCTAKFGIRMLFLCVMSYQFMRPLDPILYDYHLLHFISHRVFTYLLAFVILCMKVITILQLKATRILCIQSPLSLLDKL